MEEKRPHLPNFFAKYPQKFSVMTAIKTIHKEVESAQKCLKEDKDSMEYLRYLKKAHSMIEDLFSELGINPHDYN